MLHTLGLSACGECPIGQQLISIDIAGWDRSVSNELLEILRDCHLSMIGHLFNHRKEANINYASAHVVFNKLPMDPRQGVTGRGTRPGAKLVEILLRSGLIARPAQPFDIYFEIGTHPGGAAGWLHDRALIGRQTICCGVSIFPPQDRN